MTKIWERQIAIFFIVAALAGLLIYVGLFIQAYITHNPAFELLGLGYSSFKPGFELLGCSALVFHITGYLALFIARSISILVGIERKRFGYISAVVGAILVFFSCGLSFISRKPGQEWWGYFYMVTLGTGFISMTFSTLVGTERKSLRYILGFITFLLMLGAFVLFVLELHNADTIAINAASL